MVNATHVDIPLLSVALLAPPELRCLALPKSEHTELLANPARDALHQADLETTARSFEIDVCARDEFTEDADGFWSIERVAERGSEGSLTCMETERKSQPRTDQHTKTTLRIMPV